MVKAVAAAVLLPLPAWVLVVPPVQVAVRVAEAVRLETAQECELGQIPALAAIRSQLSVSRAREGPEGSIGLLRARRVEVTADDAWMPGRRRHVPEHRLVRQDLREPGARTDGRVDVDDFDVAQANRK